MKRVIAMMMIVIFLSVPIVMAQEENNFDEAIFSMETNTVNMGYFEAPVNLTITIFVPEDVELTIDVYRQHIQVFGVHDGVVGNFTKIHLIDVSGMHELRIYNPEMSPVDVTGWWAINWNGTITNTTTTGTETTTTGNITWTGNGPPPVMPDYWGIFLDVMFRWVAPALVGLIIVALIYRKCRVEGFDYLTIFEDREMLAREDDDDAV